MRKLLHLVEHSDCLQIELVEDSTLQDNLVCDAFDNSVCRDTAPASGTYLAPSIVRALSQYV